jgi:antitoxin HigA-1
MAMHNPPHPGAFIQEVYLTPNAISCRELALKLGVAASTLNRVLNEASGVSPEMALRLSKALGRSPESWLTMQDNYDYCLMDMATAAGLEPHVTIKKPKVSRKRRNEELAAACA